MTPKQFARQLELEAEWRIEPAGPVGAPYAGIPRKRSEEELLTEQERLVLMMRRKGHTLQSVGDFMGLSRERVRRIQLRAARRWEYHNGPRPLECEPWYSCR